MIINENKCRLCSKEAKLCNSHVIPEFFYEKMQLYDNKHRFNILSTELCKKPSFEQKGIHEKLLCEKCERKFSLWEGYARGLLYGGKYIEIISNDEKGFECIVEYKKFKLFQLSILWRVGVSTHTAFSSITIGEHESVLRRMLLEETPGMMETYGCVIIYSSKHTDITSNMIHCMGMSDVDGVECVRLLLGGFFWLFFLSETEIDPRQKGLFLQGTGHLRILKTEKDPNQYIKYLAKELHNANQLCFNHFDK